MTFVGADSDELDQLKLMLISAGTRLDDICSTISRALQSTTWEGSDAETFHSDWQNAHLTSLHAAMTGLNESARTLGRQAALQRQASDVYSSLDPLPFAGLPIGLMRVIKGVSNDKTGASSIGGARGWTGTISGKRIIDGVPFSGSSSVYVKANATAAASGTASWTQGLSGTATVGVGVLAGVTATGMVGSSNFGASATGTASVGAEARGTVDGAMGPTGVKVGATGSAFAGGQASASMTENVGGVDTIETVGVSYGVGVSGHADLSATMTDVHFSIGGSATLGLGVSGGMTINVDPRQVAQNVNHEVSDAGSWLSSHVHF